MKQQSKLQRTTEQALNSYYHLCTQLAFHFKGDPSTFPEQINGAMDKLEKSLEHLQLLVIKNGQKGPLPLWKYMFRKRPL